MNNAVKTLTDVIASRSIEQTAEFNGTLTYGDTDPVDVYTIKLKKPIPGTKTSIELRVRLCLPTGQTTLDTEKLLKALYKSYIGTSNTDRVIELLAEFLGFPERDLKELLKDQGGVQ